MEMTEFMKPSRSHKLMEDGGTLITVRPPPESGFDCVSEVRLTADQFERYKQWLHEGGVRLVDVLPELTAEVREQLISGITPQAWDDAFPDDED
jgi:hypothetical protein